MSGIPAIARPVDVPAAIEPRRRIDAVDVLRGLALLGMILVHFHQEIEIEAEGAEGLIGWFTWIFVETKAWGTFAFLFGVGFAVLMRSFEARGVPVVRYYLRRLLGLALFGLVAEIAFGFQILLDYAMWGVPLLFLRRCSTRALMIIAVLSVAVSTLAPALHEAYQARSISSFDGRAFRVLEDLHAAELSGSYDDVVKARLAYVGFRFSHWTTYLPGPNLALFIIGLLSLRCGILEDPRRNARLIAGWMLFGLASWALAWLAAFFAPPVPVAGMTWPVHSLLGLVQDQWLCFTYIGGLLLVATWRPGILKRMSALAAAGRMALTNYMLQIAVLDFLASGYGIGLRARPLASVAGTALLFGGLVIFSRFWLVRYLFGPLEWLWRSFTYLKWQRLRRTNPSAHASA